MGLKHAQVAYLSIKAIFAMAAANYMAAHPQGQSIPLVAHATHVTPTALELRRR